MQNELEQIEAELTERIYKLFMEKYKGNKSEFARIARCRETTVRRILKNEQGITVNLLIRVSFALDVEVTELLNGLSLRKR